jgi:hypothetical protein
MIVLPIFGSRAPGRFELLLINDRCAQRSNDDHRHDDHTGPGQPVEAVALHRDEQVLFQVAGQDEADQGRRTRPAELLHQPPQDAHQQQGDQIAPAVARLVGGEGNDQNHEGCQVAEGHDREFGDRLGQEQGQTGAEDVGQGQAPDGGVEQIDIFGHHGRAGLDAQDQEPSQKNRHGAGSRNAEQKGRDQAAALLGVVGALGCDDAPDVALAETLAILAGLDDVTVGDPVHHRAAQARNESDDDTDGGAAQDDELVAQGVFESVQPALAEFGLFGNRAALDQQVDDLGEGKQTQSDDHQGNPVHEIVDPEGVPVLGDGRRVSRWPPA